MPSLDLAGLLLCGRDLGAHYLKANRPWLTLYGLRVKNTVDGDISEKGWFQGKVPEELMLAMLSRVDPYTLGKASCVCRLWRILGNNPLLWQKACMDAFSQCSFEENVKTAQAAYRASWRRMFLERPHLRYSGLYVSRNTYLKTGIAEWRVRNPVHLVAYFRYLRFFPGGQFLYRTSPEKPTKVTKSMRIPQGANSKAQWNDTSGVLRGKYGAKEDLLCCVTVYPDSHSTELKLRLRLRSTIMGAHDRLDVLSITTGSSNGFEQVVAEALDVEEDFNGEDGLRHKRGTMPFVFVPWEKISSSPLNLPVDRMDFYVPG